MSVLSYLNVPFLLFVVAVVYLRTMAQKEYSPEDFPYFFNVWSFDVLDLDKYDFKTTNSCVKCPRIFLPICGDDNKTYTNECKMACMNYMKNKNPPVNMSRTGPCDVFSAN